MTEELPFCECGCGLRVRKKGHRFIYNHHRIGKKHTIEACLKMSVALTGRTLSPEHCDAISAGGRNSEAAKAYHESMRGVPKSPEACAAMSDAHEGVPLSPEHSYAITKGLQESDAVKVAYDAMIGGNDILKHHHIYDHDDLSKYTIEMTRSQHMGIHQNMKFLGLKVPHINTGYENEDEFKLMEYIRKMES